MLSKSYSSVCIGIDVRTVTVEVDVSQGIAFHMVGLPDSSVRESQQRIGVALAAYGYRIPGRKVVVNLAPADVRKSGAALDLAIAAGILDASGQVSFPDLGNVMMMGELALDGTVRYCRGCLPVAVNAAGEGFRACIFPKNGAMEASGIEGISIYGVETFGDVLDVLAGRSEAERLRTVPFPYDGRKDVKSGTFDLSFVKGQPFAKRALEIAACGGHSLLLSGPPGSGKSLLAKALPSILPPLSEQESMESSIIYSVAGELGCEGLLRERPFRSPHHSCSVAALVGGGTVPSPGEVTMAHNGVLYLDEMPEFSRSALESLRQPLEDGFVMVSRSSYRVRYPASFMLVGSMNPCPCGYAGTARCRCTDREISRYFSRISGPLMDRMDMFVNVSPSCADDLLSDAGEESSAVVASRVEFVRKMQQERYSAHPSYGNVYCNASLVPSMIARFCRMSADAENLMRRMESKWMLSARSFLKVIKLARTIADMERSELICSDHISEAVAYKIPSSE